MKIPSYLRFLFLIFIQSVSPFSACLAGEVVVMAGAASKPPLEEAVQAFERKTGIKISLDIAGSGILLNKLRLSMPGDIYMPGSPDFMIKAKRFGLISTESEIIIAYLIPAINVARGNPKAIKRLNDLTRPGLKVGIADPKGVCVGLYAIEIFQKNHMLNDVKKNICAIAESCEKTAALIPLKSVDATLGWREFEFWNSRAIQSIPLQPEEIARIGYISAAITKSGKNQTDARKLLAFLSSEEGRNYFKKWGYLTTESEARHFAPTASIGGEYQVPEEW